MKKLLALAFLLIPAIAGAGDAFITSNDVTVPETSACAKFGVARTNFYEQVVECDIGEKFYVKIPADDSMTAILTHDFTFTSPSTSGNCSGWNYKIAAFPRGGVYNSKTVSLGSAGGISVPHDTSIANSFAKKISSKTLFNADTGASCASDSDCDDSAFLWMEMERVSCGGGDVGNPVRFEADHISW